MWEMAELYHASSFLGGTKQAFPKSHRGQLERGEEKKSNTNIYFNAKAGHIYLLSGVLFALILHLRTTECIYLHCNEI